MAEAPNMAQEEKTQKAAEKQDKTQEKKQEVAQAKNVNTKNGTRKYAIVNATRLRISTKDSMSICKMIKGKTSERALEMLGEVLAMKRVVKMNNREVPHKHGKGIMAGRYPLNATKEFIRLIKQLNANAIVNEIPLEEAVISGIPNVGSRSYRRMGQRFKSTNLSLKLEVPKIKKGKKKKYPKGYKSKKQGVKKS